MAAHDRMLGDLISLVVLAVFISHIYLPKMPMSSSSMDHFTCPFHKSYVLSDILSDICQIREKYCNSK